MTFYDGSTEIGKEGFTVTTGLASFPTPESKTGYVFEHWKDEQDNKVTSIPANTPGDKKFYALWTSIQYTLTYDLNGGSYAGTNPVSYTYTTQPSLLTEQDVSYTGYKFLHWILNGSPITGTPVSGGSESDGGRKMDFTVSAEWELIDYKIVFYETGGTKVDSRKYNVEDGISEDEMPTTEWVGHKFLGWFIGDKRITEIKPGSEPLELYARWELLVYSIRYELNGGTNPENAQSSYTYDDHVVLLDASKEHYEFDGWFTDRELTNPISKIPNHTTGDKTFYAKWSPIEYTLTLDPNGGRISQTTQEYEYGEVTEFARKPYRDKYDFAGWYYDKECTRPYGEKITADKSGDHTIYAKWTLAKYAIELDCYYGKFQTGTNVPAFYTYGSTVEKLPTPVRDGFTFGGWYADDLLTNPVSTPVIKATDSGNKKFYATWDRGYQLIVSQPSNGQITVKRNGAAVSAGSMVGKGETLEVSAEPTTSGYALKNLTIDGVAYTSSPQTVVMPEKDLKISAEFTTSSLPSAPAPKIVTDPINTDKVAFGTTVKVKLEKSDASTSLYYALNEHVSREYTGEFLVDGNSADTDTVVIRAIARKSGYSDGITTRKIVFDGRVVLTFDLPNGVKATNPTGGEVVSAIVKGGTFEFKLDVNKDYFASLDSMKVLANDSIIQPNASGLYVLSNQTSDVTVKVTGLTVNECTVTLLQTTNGQIAFTDAAGEDSLKVSCGDTVSITATADEDFKFLEWNDGNQSNPRTLVVSKDVTLSAKFISDYKAYAMILPDVEGVTVKPFSGYSTEVKKGEAFKFYLSLSKGYHEGKNLIVKANGETLVKNKGGYAIYKIDKNIRISVEGIERDTTVLKLTDHVSALDLKTLKDATTQSLFDEDRILLYAETLAGQVFSKWNDGKVDNPRVTTVIEAAQLLPLYNKAEEETYAKIHLQQTAGAGIAMLNANVDAVHEGEDVQLKVVLLPAYSQSQVTLTANDKAIEPEASLRSSSETRTLIYTLPNVKESTEVKLSGLVLNTYKLTTAQTEGGSVSVSATTVKHGTTVQLEATPLSGKIFVKWWDGNTVNPYPYSVTSDTEVKAFFMGETSTVANEEIEMDQTQLKVSGSTLYIETAENSALYIWDYKGALLYNRHVPAGIYSCPLPAGVYLVKVGEGEPQRVVVR